MIFYDYSYVLNEKILVFFLLGKKLIKNKDKI